MSTPSPVRLVFFLVVFSGGVLCGFFFYVEKGRLSGITPIRTRSAHLRTKVQGETTEIELPERFIAIEWLSFEQEQVDSVCRASEIIRDSKKIFLRDPIIYDYSRETETVTRTSGQFGEATLKDGAVRELDTVRIWGNTMLFRYKANPNGLDLSEDAGPELTTKRISGIQ